MLQKNNTLELFFINPDKEYYLLEISRKIKLAHTSVKKNLNTLIKQNLITKSIEIKGKRKFPIYKANKNKLFKKQKSIYNLYSILQSNLTEFLEEQIMPKTIILFGSYQRGEDTIDSDIDFFIESKEKKLYIKNFEKILNRKIQLHFKENFNSYPKELKNNIINGTTIYGFLEGFK